MMKNPVGWFEIYVSDMARARAFYEATLGRKLNQLPETLEHVDIWAFDMQEETYGATGALVKMDGMLPGGNSVLVYFGCPDCAVESARALEAGGQIVKPKFSIGPYGFIALILDTEGNMFGLHSMQ